MDYFVDFVSPLKADLWYRLKTFAPLNLIKILFTIHYPVFLLPLQILECRTESQVILFIFLEVFVYSLPI